MKHMILDILWREKNKKLAIRVNDTNIVGIDIVVYKTYNHSFYAQ